MVQPIIKKIEERNLLKKKKLNEVHVNDSVHCLYHHCWAQEDDKVGVHSNNTECLNASNNYKRF